MLGHTQMGQDNRRSKQHDHVLHKNRILCTVFPKLVNEVPRRLVKSSKISKFSPWAEKDGAADGLGLVHKAFTSETVFFSCIQALFHHYCFLPQKTQMFASCHGQKAHYPHHSPWIFGSVLPGAPRQKGQRGR